MQKVHYVPRMNTSQGANAGDRLGLQETLKSVIAQYNASQLLTMREARPS
jgi:hypothetical protein